MDEAWERAVEAALGGQAHSSSSAQPPRTLTLDGSVKCLHGRLPPPEILERYQSLEHLSIANIGVSSLEKFPRLRNLQRLILSDNRIAGGLECLVEAGLDSLRVLDLSNNRIQFLEDLAPLAHLRLTSLDLYECPVTRIKDYRSRVFWMIRTLKDLDKMDADENERPESDEEEDEEEEEEEEEDEEEDPGSGEVDGDDRVERLANGVANNGVGGIVDVDEEEESDAEEEDTEASRGANVNGYHASNGFRVALVREASDDGEDDDEEEEDIDEEDDVEDNDEDLGEEIDAEEGEEEDVVEVLDIGDSDEEDDDDGVEEDGEEELDEEDEYEDGERDEDEEDVEDEEDDGEPQCSRRMTSIEGEIDGHEQGEERDEDKDENGEIGEEDEPEVDDDRYSEEGDGEDEDEDDDTAGEYLVQPIAQPAYEAVGSDDCNEDDEDEVDDDEDVALLDQPSSSSQVKKRKRDKEDRLDDDSVEDMSSSKHR